MLTVSHSGVKVDRRPPSETGLKWALSAAQAGIWEWNLSTNENHWSDDTWQLYGLDRLHHDASYANWLHSIHPDDRAFAQQSVGQSSQRGEPIALEWRTNPALGPVRWILSRGHPVHDSMHGTVSYTGIVLDITARKEAEAAVLELNQNLEKIVAERTVALSENRRLLQHILDGVPGLVGYWTHELINQFANKSYSEWFGMSAEQIKGRHISELLGPELLKQNQPYIERALQGEAQCFEREIPIPGSPGEFRVSEAHYLPDIVNGHVQGFLVMVFDISGIKKAERHAEAASQAKSEFLANISHELRTPLNAMFGLAQVGARDMAGTPAMQLFDQILESGQHLLSLVDDVLDFSKIEAGKMKLELEEMDIGQLIEHTIAMTQVRAQAKGLHMVIDESTRVPQSVLADTTRVSQILLNLVSNAIKFTSEGSITIKLDYQAPMLTMEVIDSGIGIAPDKIQHLFQPFEQAHQGRLQRIGGTGLGLAISKRLSTLMNGHITVKSQPDKGSHFTFALPVQVLQHCDFSPLKHVALIGMSDQDGSALRAAIVARQGEIIAIDQLPHRYERPAVVVIHESELLMQDQQALEPLASSGSRLLIWSQGPEHLAQSASPRHIDAVTITGPLSPMRLLHALRQRPKRTQAQASERLAGMRILAAEDNPVNRLVLEQMLEQEGARVTFAQDGEQALEQVRNHGEHTFDVVLCDIQMPVMDGYETTEALGRMAPHLPVIGLTAHAFTSARQQAKQAGMVAYVTKPYLLDTLVNTIREHARWRPSMPSAVADAPKVPAMEEPISAATQDWLAMKRHFQSQPLLFDRLVHTLAQTLPDILQQLDTARHQHDIKEVAKIAHNIKGTALNLHTPDLAGIAIQTQDQARLEHANALLSAQDLSHALSQFMALFVPEPTLPSEEDDDSVNQAIRTNIPKNGRRDLLN
jgi:PAS domain S-box-containing protein